MQFEAKANKISKDDFNMFFNIPGDTKIGSSNIKRRRVFGVRDFPVGGGPDGVNERNGVIQVEEDPLEL